MKKFITFAFLPLVLASCATILSGTTQRVSVQAIDAQTHQLIPNAQCSIRDGKNNFYTVSGNPGSVIVSRGNGALQASCTRKGYHQNSVGVGQSFNGWSIVNVVWLPGAIVDAATGAMTRYPSHITVLMTHN